MPTRIKIPEEAMKYFRLTGAAGGKARAAKYPQEQLRRWAKLGGRPKGSGKKRKGGR